MGRRGDVRCSESVVAAADRNAIDAGAGGGNLHAAGDDGFRPAHAVARNAVIGALEGHVLVDVHVLVVGAGRDSDRVAGRGRVDCRLDGGIAAMADEQDIGRTGAVDLLDAGERVGALGTARSDDEVAEPVVGEHRTGDRRGIDRGVDPAAADESVVAAAAGEDVDAAIAGQRIVAAAAGDVLDPGHGGEAGRAGRAEIDRHGAGGAGIVERIDAAGAVDGDALHIGRGHALDRGDDAGAVDGDMDGVVARGPGHREGVGVRAAVDRVDAVADGVLDQVVAGAAVDGVVAEPAGRACCCRCCR